VLPVQATPLTAKFVGAGLAVLFHDPLKPIVVEPPVVSEPFQLSLTAVTCVPDCVYVALQPWVTCWPAAKFQVSVQELTGLPRLVIASAAVNPPGHCDETEYATEHPADAALEETAPATAAPHATAAAAMPAATRRNPR
jgi:hypothetical protein